MPSTHPDTGRPYFSAQTSQPRPAPQAASRPAPSRAHSSLSFAVSFAEPASIPRTSAPPTATHANFREQSQSTRERRSILAKKTSNATLNTSNASYGATDSLRVERSPDEDLSRHLNTPSHRLSRSRWSGTLRVPDWVSNYSASTPPSPTHHSGSYSHTRLPSMALEADEQEQRRLRKWKKDYSDEFQLELARQTGNGIRVWYESYCTIDWLHEVVKESIRRKKLAQMPGWVGRLSRVWDRSQAWVLVTLVGICTAFVAAQIVSMEMWLFDIKEGYCTNGWRKPKRFCCKPVDQHTAVASYYLQILSIFERSNLIPYLNPHAFSGLSPSDPLAVNSTQAFFQRPPAFSSQSFISQWSPKHAPVGPSAESCPDWRLWTDAFSSGRDPQARWKEYAIYLFFCLIFAGLSSLLTVYLSRSTQIHSTDSALSDSALPADYLYSPPLPAGSRGPPLSSLTRESAVHQAPKVPPKVSYFAAGSGIPEVKCILSGFVIRGYLGMWTMITKSIGLSLSVGSGLSLGKEGPLVHIASCIGNIFTRLFPKFDRNEGKRREMISAACAAGVSTAFGAPIGGVLFSLEEVSYYFPPRVMWRSFWCALVAAATLRVLDPFRTGKTVLFEVSYDQQWHFLELGGFVLLGLFGGIFGAWFAILNTWWAKRFRKQTWVASHPVWEVLLVASATCLLGFSNRFMKLGGPELVYEMLAECKFNDRAGEVHRPSLGPCIDDPQDTARLVLNMGVAALLKFLITIVTFGIKCPAGIFVPSLAIGALLGRCLGYGVEYAFYAYPDASVFGVCDPARGFGQACVVPGVWAMVGAAAMLAGVTRTTVSLAVIVMELTGSLVYILPISISVLVAKTTADAIERRSIYDLVIEASELPYLDAKSEYLHYAQPIDIMDNEAQVIELEEDLRASDLRRSLALLHAAPTACGGFPLLEASADGERRIAGYIGVNELTHGLSTIDGDPLCTFSGSDPDARPDTPASHEPVIDLGHLVDHAPVTVSVKTPMELIHEMFVKLGIRYLVIQDQCGSYVGIIEKNRWLRYLSWIEQKGYQAKKKQDWFV